MLKKLSIVLMAGIAGMTTNDTVFAEAPDIVAVYAIYNVHNDSSFNSVEIFYTGNVGSPSPIVVVVDEDGNGWAAGHSGEHGGLDCTQTVNRPACQTLQFVNDIDACDGPPDFIVIDPDGHGAQIYCSGNDGSPPPIVIVNGEVVRGY